MIIFKLIFGFVVGASFGSFLSCLIFRLTHKINLLKRSFCPYCEKPIKWNDNIPVFSFLFLRRKCRYCRNKISWENFIVEFLLGVSFGLIALLYSFPQFIFYWIIIFALFFLFLDDLKNQKVELSVLWPLTLLVAAFDLYSKQSLWSIFVSLIIASVFFLGQYFLTKKKGIGIGDFWIGILMAFILVQPKFLITALFLSYLIGAFISVLLLIAKKCRLKTTIPLAPFLTTGTLITFFWGEKIIGWYLSLF